MAQQGNNLKSMWSGVRATYRATCSSSFLQQVQSNNRKKFGFVLPKDSSQGIEADMAICSRAIHCEWRHEGKANSIGTFIQIVGSPGYFILHKQRAFFSLSKPQATSIKRQVTVIDTKRILSERFGNIKLIELSLDADGIPTSSVHLHVGLLEEQPAIPFALSSWWSMILPVFGEPASALGLPARVELFFGFDKSPSVSVELTQKQKQDFPLTMFLPPPNYKYLQPNKSLGERQSGKPLDNINRNTERVSSGASALREGSFSASVQRHIFSSLPNEDVKVVLHGRLLSKLVETLNNTWSYLDRFEGSDFVFNTNTWPKQVFDNAPVPVAGASGSNKSVLGGLLRRIGFALLFNQIMQIRADPQQRGLLLNALNNPIIVVPHPWLFFLLSLSRREKDKLREMLDEQQYKSDGNFPADLISDLQGNPVGGLGEKWLSFITPNLDITPNITNILPDKAIFMLGVVELIDVVLSDWENTIVIDRQPLMDEPQFVYESNFDTFLPGKPVPENFRFGLFTRLKMKELSISFDVSTNPTSSGIAVVGLGLFCPPCYAALWQTGWGIASVTDIEIPTLIYLEEDELGLVSGKFKALVSDIQFANPDVSIYLLSPFPLLSAAVSAIASFVLDFILDSMLRRLSGNIQDGINNLLNQIPEFKLDSVVSLESIWPILTKTKYQSREYLDVHTLELSAADIAPNAGPLIFQPDADIALLLSHVYVNRILSTKGVGYGELEFKYPIEGLPTDGQPVNWWNDAPAKQGLTPVPSNMFSRPPTSSFSPYLPGTPLPPPFYAYWSRLRIRTLEPVLKDFDNPTPDEPIAERTVKVVIDVGAALYEPGVYEWCEPGRVFRVPDERGPREPFGIDMTRPTSIEFISDPRLIRDVNELQPPGTMPVDWNPGSIRFSYGLTPPPDSVGPPQVPGGEFMECEWRLFYTAKEQQAWLRVEAELKFSLFLGIVYAFNPTKTRLVPTIGCRVDANINTTDVTITNIQAAHFLSWLDSQQNSAQNREWIKELIVRVAKPQLESHGGPQELKYVFGYFALGLLPWQPEILDPFVYLTLSTNPNEALSADPPNTKPSHIGLRPFGGPFDLMQRHVGLNFYLLENILNRI